MSYSALVFTAKRNFSCCSGVSGKSVAAGISVVGVAVAVAVAVVVADADAVVVAAAVVVAVAGIAVPAILCREATVLSTFTGSGCSTCGRGFSFETLL